MSAPCPAIAPPIGFPLAIALSSLLPLGGCAESEVPGQTRGDDGAIADEGTRGPAALVRVSTPDAAPTLSRSNWFAERRGRHVGAVRRAVGRLARAAERRPGDRSIVAPTLAISLEDDRFLTADAARHIAASVPGARLLLYPSGGHVWVGHDAELFAAINAFLDEIDSMDLPRP